jgi:hypothetical protein
MRTVLSKSRIDSEFSTASTNNLGYHEEGFTMRKVAIWVALLAVCTGLSTRSAPAAMTAQKKQKALERARYIEYKGKQQDWPQNDQPMLEVQNTKYGVSIYSVLPDKPYEVLGTIQVAGSSTVRHAAEAAQAAGADAILVVKHKAFVDAGIEIDPQMSTRGSRTGKVQLLNGLLIRWKRE